jgi:hypothetical protein
MRMYEKEDFEVEVPKCSGFSIGDIVEPIMNINLRDHFILGKGLVVKIDNDPSQDILPLFFVHGLTTNIRSPLKIETLRRVSQGVLTP